MMFHVGGLLVLEDSGDRLVDPWLNDLVLSHRELREV